VPQFQGYHINAFPLEKSYECLLISIDHGQVRIDAEYIHIDPIAADAFV
jgi:hypothetical protein